ncbi:RNA polymerase sigma factor [Ktedonosporobacter rubrisoli]|nr:RNA polymerase sigma factor [Ktedonosporobacter rubrisoli]
MSPWSRNRATETIRQPELTISKFCRRIVVHEEIERLALSTLTSWPALFRPVASNYKANNAHKEALFLLGFLQNGLSFPPQAKPRTEIPGRLTHFCRSYDSKGDITRKGPSGHNIYEMQQQTEPGSDRQKTVTELYHRHAASIFAFLCQRTASREDAEDILLEVFTAGLQQPRLSQMSATEQRLWLWRVARNKMVDAYRRANQKRAAFSLEEMGTDACIDEDQTPESEVVRWEEYGQLQHMLSELSPLQQQVLQMRFVQNMRSAEIARHIGKSEGAVRTLLSRTLNLLRTAYRKDIEA